MSDKNYKCNTCGYNTKDKSNYNKHFKRKSSCVPQKKVNGLTKDKDIADTKLIFYKEKTKVLENECKKKQMEIVKREKEIERLYNLLEHKLENNNSMVKAQLERVVEKLDTQTSFNSANNNYLINNSHNNVLNNNYNVILAPLTKERYDHITQERMLHILLIPNHNDLIAELINAVYFDPRAPENWSWCVNDKKSKEGSLEFNHDTNTLIRQDTDTLITKRLKAVVYGIGDMMEELNLTNSLNDTQAFNYHKLVNMVGMMEYDKAYIKAIQDVAFEGRQFPHALWCRLGYGIETKTFVAKIKRSVYNKARIKNTI